MKKTLIIFPLLIFLCLAGIASAEVTLHNVTPTWQHVEFNQSVDFNYSTPYGVSTSHWFINGEELNYTGFNLSYTFVEPRSYNVSVWAETTEGNSSMLEYRVSVSRERATEHLTPYNNSNYEPFLDSVTDMNATGIMTYIVTPFTDVTGRLFYCVLFLLPFVFLFINHGGKLTVPVTLIMITGVFIISYLPDAVKGFIAIVVAASWAGNLYKISRGK